MTASPQQPVVPDGSIPPHAGERRFVLLEQRKFLRWLYLGRALLAIVVLVRAALDRSEAPEAARTVLLVVLLAFAVIGYGFYVTFIRRSRAGLFFLLGQAAADLFLVTTLVHFEGMEQSGLAALYVLVMAVYALLMPLRLGLFTVLLGVAIFLADAYLAHPVRPGGWVWGQVAVVTVVFLVVAFLGQRLRAASFEQTQLESELRRVQLEAASTTRMRSRSGWPAAASRAGWSTGRPTSWATTRSRTGST